MSTHDVTRRFQIQLTKHGYAYWVGSVAFAPGDFRLYEGDTARDVLKQITTAIEQEAAKAVRRWQEQEA